MSKKKNTQRIIIYAMVGVMFFSVVGTAVLLIVSERSQKDSINEEELSQIEDQLEQSESNAEPLPAPAVALPEGDVTQLQIIDVKEGAGAEVRPGGSVKVHYHGVLASDGSVFDSSYERGEPIEFSLEGVIAGWQEGIPGMKVGGIRQLNIPSEKAYGDQGAGESIPPNADLVFVVELVEVK